MNETLETIAMYVLIFVVVGSIIVVFFAQIIPMGEEVEKVGTIVDIQYTDGAYGRSASSYITFDDGECLNLEGTRHGLKVGYECIVTYTDGSYKHFISVEYLED